MFRRKKDGTILLKAGGRWDRLTSEYTDTDASRGLIIDVRENQVAVVKQFTGWLAKYIAGEKRERIILTGGNRRGGKSFITTACAIAMALVDPGAICWMVSPNLTKRDELERYVKELTLPAWRTYRGMPEYRFYFPNGSTIQSITGDTADALKRGKASMILFNEPQDCAVDIATYGLPALIDSGGLALFAGNPARRQKGEWFNNLRQAIVDGETTAGVFFDVPAIDNDTIDQDARKDFGDLLRILDPRAAKADDEGAWMPIGDRAYPKFHKGLVRPLSDLGDVTREYTKKRTGRTYDFVAGADFQATPWHAMTVLKVFAGPDGKNIYHVCDEIIAEQSTEDDLLDLVEEHGYSPETLFTAADASGSWQDGKHAFRGRVSYDFFKARRFHIAPPQVRRRPDKSEHSKNPAIEDRLSLLFKLMDEGRLLVDGERCPRLVEALKECPLKNINGRRRPHGRHAHETDALGYSLWYLEPRPTAPMVKRGPDAFSVPITRRGSDVI